MADSFASRIIAAHQAGLQVRRQREQKETEAEDRQFTLKQREAQLRLDKINEQLAKRKLEQENAQAMQGIPAPVLGVSSPQATPMPFPGQIGQGPSMEAPPQNIPLPLPAQEISGVEELGISGYRQPITSMQQMLQQKNEAARLALEQKRQESAAEPFTLAEGASRVIPQPGGQSQVFTNPKAPPKPSDVSFQEATYEDFIKDPNLTNKYGATRVGFARWQSDMVESRQRPLAPIVIQTPAGPQVLDRGTLTAQPIQSGGETVGLLPTADQRNRQAALKNIDGVLGGISELSEKINTGAGLIAKVSGEAEKAKARLNYNDDVAEYNALISGFTPMVARAVGHTGVLTEQDVQSVREMFPKPGDSKTLRDRKISRIRTILNSITAQPESPDADIDARIQKALRGGK